MNLLMTHGGFRLTKALPFGAFVLFAGCGSSTADNGIVSLTVTVGTSDSQTLVLGKGEPVPLRVVADEASGQGMDVTSQAAYSSRDTTIATVSSSGVVTGRNAGSTFVVAGLGVKGRSLSDSVRVLVSAGF